jgi:hypothetical protein
MIKSMVARSNGDWELGFGQIASVKENHPKYAEHILFEIGEAAMGAGRQRKNECC